jgi:hypothetical protein
MNERFWKIYGESIIGVNEDGGDVVDPIKFAELIVGHATECVRDVLRDENSDLSYVAAIQVQNRIKEFFEVEK